jgi:hypothetical protein
VGSTATLTFARGSAIVCVSLPVEFPSVAPRVRLMSCRFCDPEGRALAVDVPWPAPRDTAAPQAARLLRYAPLVRC